MQEVSHLGVLGVHVELVLLIAGHLDGLAIDHLETETIESVDLGRIVGHEDELMNAQRIRGQVPDSCLSCEFSILWEGFEFIKGASRESCLAF